MLIMFLQQERCILSTSRMPARANPNTRTIFFPQQPSRPKVRPTLQTPRQVNRIAQLWRPSSPVLQRSIVRWERRNVPHRIWRNLSNKSAQAPIIPTRSGQYFARLYARRTSFSS
jgi:hypothetical protein